MIINKLYLRVNENGTDVEPRSRRWNARTSRQMTVTEQKIETSRIQTKDIDIIESELITIDIWVEFGSLITLDIWVECGTLNNDDWLSELSSSITNNNSSRLIRIDV